MSQTFVMNTVIEWAVNSVYTQDSEHSGAIDVIVVRRSDGTLYSSPFHVKIGSGRRRKLNSKADRDKGVVRLRKVSNSISPNNNEARYISMKLGPAGEAFFVQKNSKQLSFNECKIKESTAIHSEGQFIEASSNTRNNVFSEKTGENTLIASTMVEKSDFQLNSVNRRVRSFSEGSNIAAPINNLITVQNDPLVSTTPSLIPVSVIAVKPDDSTSHQVISSTTITSPFIELPIYKRLRSLSEICLPLPPVSSPYDAKRSDVTNPANRISENSPISLIPAEQPRTPETTTSKPPPVPAAAPVSWIWSWGSLPVKSKIQSSADLKAIAESKQPDALEVSPPSIQLPSPPINEPTNILQNYLKQQMERAQSFEDIRIGNYGTEALPLDDSPVPEAPRDLPTSIQPEISCESKSGQGGNNTQLDTKLFSEHDPTNRSVSPTPDPRHNVLMEDLAFDHSSFDFAFDIVDSTREHTRMVLSQCGHILSEHRTAPEPAPLTVEQLLRVLYSYRVTKNDLQQLHHQAVKSDHDVMVSSADMLLQNPNLVVVLGGTLYNSKDAEVIIDRHLSKQSSSHNSSSSLRSIVFSMFNEALEKDFQESTSGDVGIRASHSFVSCNIPGQLATMMKSRSSDNSLLSLSTLEPVSEIGLPLSQDSFLDSANILRGSSSNPELACSDTWSGKRILSWKNARIVHDSTTLHGSSTRMNDNDIDACELVSAVEPQEADFMNWSQNELGWRSSFTDLLQAYSSQRLERLNSQCDAISLKRSCCSQMEFKYSNESLSVNNDDAGLHSSQPIESPDDEAVTKEQEAVIADAPTIEAITSLQEHAANIPQISAPIEVEIETDNDHISLEDIALDEISLEPTRGDYNDSDTDSYLSLSLEDGESGSLTSGDRESHRGKDRHRFGDTDNSSYLQQYRQQTQRRYRYRKVLVPSQEQLEMLDLQDGLNEIEFELDGYPPLRSHLFVWPDNAKVVVTEIEGVVKNCVASSKQQQSMKAWVPFLGGGANTPNSAVCFDGSIETFNELTSKGYQIIYLTRDGQGISNFNSVGGAGKERHLNASKAYLSSFCVPTAGSSMMGPPKSRSLPIGPILRSPESLVRGASWNINSLVFRSAALRGVRNLFPANHNPYHACFATNESDMVAFSRFGFPDGRIFFVSEKGHIRCYNRASVITSFRELSELSNEIFPEIVVNKRTAPGVCAYYLGAQWNTEGLPACSQVCVRCSKRLLTDSYVVNSGNSATTKFESTLDTCSPQRSDGKKSTVVARSTAVADDSYSDFNFWRVPIPNLDE